MSESVSEAPAPEVAATGLPAGPGVAGVPRRRSDFLHYGLRNKKLLFGLGVELILVLVAIIGPYLAKNPPMQITVFPLQHPGG